MKRNNYILITSTLCLSILSGCVGQAASTEQPANGWREGHTIHATADQTASTEQPANGVIMTIPSPKVEFVDSADSLDELIAASDLIAEITVAETDFRISSTSKQIYTKITPEIKKVYKGSFEDAVLELTGGYADYTTYTDAVSYELDSEHTEGERKSALVYADWCNTYIPTVGDTLLFFGKYTNDDTYTLTNGYQGMFRLEGDRWTNQALIIDDKGWQEPLATDLLSLSGAEAAAPDDADTFTSDGITYSKPQSTYETEVSVPTETLAALIDETCA